MGDLLIIRASARQTRSISRDMTDAFLRTWRDVAPDCRVTEREIGLTPPPFVSEAWIAACFKPENVRTPEDREILGYSDSVIAEVVAADVIVVGSPMYNYGMPAQLKAWVDMVVRVNKTFTFDPTERTWPLTPTMRGKRLILLAACGEFGFDPGGVREHWNHLDTHLKVVAHYLGVSADDFRCIRVEFQEYGDERHETSVKAAHAAIDTAAREAARGALSR